MKLTKKKLQRIIKEEVGKVLQENYDGADLWIKDTLEVIERHEFEDSERLYRDLMKVDEKYFKGPHDIMRALEHNGFYDLADTYEKFALKSTVDVKAYANALENVVRNI